MENITLGQIASAIGLLTVIIGFLWKIYKSVDNFNDTISSLSGQIDSIKKELNEKIDKNEFNHVKSAIINYMCMAEEYALSEEQRRNAHELYDWYIDHNGNSYVKEKWEILTKEGKI